MERAEVASALKRLYSSLPKFSDGRINYTNSRAAVVITVFVSYRGRILLLKRSQRVANYRGRWHAVGGYVDRLVSPESVALKEMREELGIKKDNVLKVNAGKAHVLIDSKAGKKWIVCPFLAELKRRPRIRLDWEHTAYKWVKPSALKGPGTVPGLGKTFRYANK